MIITDLHAGWGDGQAGAMDVPSGLAVRSWHMRFIAGGLAWAAMKRILATLFLVGDLF